MLLRRGAREVVAVDVGYGQLAWSIRQDPRVDVHDRTNIRELTLDVVGEPVDVVVGDLSFISLTLVLDALLGVTAADGDLVLMVKPQFEVGKDRVGKGGVVRDPELWVVRRRGRRRRSRSSAAGAPSASRRARCRARRATSSSSCGCAAAPATVPAEERDDVVRAGTGPSAPGEKVGP